MSYVAIAVTVGGALWQGSEAKKNGQIAKIFAESQARIDEATALDTAKIIRRSGYKQVGAARAAYAGAGVKVDEGSAAEVKDEMVSGVEHDAFQAILEGRNRATAARHNGALAEQAGRDAQTTALISATSSGLSGWRTAQRYPKG